MAATSSGCDSFSPMPYMTRGRGSRQTGTSAPVAARRRKGRGSSPASRIRPRDQAQSRRRVREPPPRPAATGRHFFEVESAQSNAGNTGLERARRLEHQIVGTLAGCAACGPAQSASDLAARRKARRSPISANDTTLSDLMIAVGAADQHAQCQIDLGRCVLDQRIRQRTSVSRRCRPFLPWLHRPRTTYPRAARI